jgi:hypothetical protein
MALFTLLTFVMVLFGLLLLLRDLLSGASDAYSGFIRISLPPSIRLYIHLFSFRQPVTGPLQILHILRTSLGEDPPPT